MNNLWLEKNPFTSMWLSSANKMTGSARAQTTAAAQREARHIGATVQAVASRRFAEFWTNTVVKPPFASSVASTRRTPR